MSKAAKNFEAIADAKARHNSSCDYPAHTIVMCQHDIERMGWEEGDTIAGLKLAVGDVQSDTFDLLCDKPQAGGGESITTEAVAEQRELQTVGAEQ